MSKYLVFTFLIATLLGCKKIDEFTKFDMEYESTIVIPNSSGINLPFNVLTPDMQSNSEATFAVNDTRKDLIEIINLIEMSLSINSPTNGNFNFLKSVKLFLNADGLGETQIAWKENLEDDNLTKIDLDLSSADLKEFIKKDEFSIRVETITDEFLTQDYEIKLYSKFFVDAKLIK